MYPFTKPATLIDVRMIKHTLMLLALGMALLFGLAPRAQAQAPAIRATSTDQIKFPPGLKWEPMREIRFQDPPKSGSKPASNDAAAAQAVWADEIKRSLEQAPNFSVAVLLAQARSSKKTLLTFSLLNVMDFDRCEPPANGKNVVDMYSKCFARVHIDQKPQVIVKEFEGFCYLNIDNNPDAPLAKNHTEFAFDARTDTGYFRVIQHGKDVPSCHRAIKLEGA